MIAPFPGFDSLEIPLLFAAITFTFTFVPQAKLKGDVIKVETGIVHYKADTIVERVPLQ